MLFPSLEAIFVQEWNFCRFLENGKSRPNPPLHREKVLLRGGKVRKRGKIPVKVLHPHIPDFPHS